MQLGTGQPDSDHGEEQPSIEEMVTMSWPPHCSRCCTQHTKDCHDAADERQLLKLIAERATISTALSDVPPALRGPGWRAAIAVER